MSPSTVFSKTRNVIMHYDELKLVMWNGTFDLNDLIVFCKTTNLDDNDLKEWYEVGHLIVCDVCVCVFIYIYIYILSSYLLSSSLHYFHLQYYYCASISFSSAACPLPPLWYQSHSFLAGGSVVSEPLHDIYIYIYI